MIDESFTKDLYRLDAPLSLDSTRHCPTPLFYFSAGGGVRLYLVVQTMSLCTSMTVAMKQDVVVDICM